MDWRRKRSPESSKVALGQVAGFAGNMGSNPIDAPKKGNMYRFNEPTFEPSPLFKEILLWLVQNKAEIHGSWDPNNDEYTICLYPSDSDEPNGQIVQEPTRITVWAKGRYNNQGVEVFSLEQLINLIEPLWEKYDPNEGLTNSE